MESSVSVLYFVFFEGFRWFVYDLNFDGLCIMTLLRHLLFRAELDLFIQLHVLP